MSWVKFVVSIKIGLSFVIKRDQMINVVVSIDIILFYKNNIIQESIEGILKCYCKKRIFKEFVYDKENIFSEYSSEREVLKLFVKRFFFERDIIGKKNCKSKVIGKVKLNRKQIKLLQG